MRLTIRLIVLLLSLYCVIAQADSYYPGETNNPNVSPQTPPSSGSVSSTTTRDLQATNDLIIALNATTYKKFADSQETYNIVAIFAKQH